MIKQFQSTYNLNGYSLIGLSVLLVVVAVMLNNVSVYAVIALLFLLPIFIYGERYLILFVLVSFFTLVGDVNPALRTIIHTIDFGALGYLFLRKYGIDFKKYPRLPKELLYFLILYYISMIVATTFSDYPSAGVVKIARQSVTFIMAYVLLAIIKDEKDLRLYLYALITAAIILVFSSLAFFAMEGFKLIDLQSGIRYRVTGLITNVTVTTGFFIVAYPLVLVFLYHKRTFYNKLIYGTLLFILNLGLLVTVSRSAILAIMFSSMFLLFYLNRKLLYRIITTIVIIILLFIFVPYLNELASLFFRIESGLTHRENYWQLAYDMIKDNWLFGIGPGAYGYKMYNYFPVMLDSWFGKVMIQTNMITLGSNNSHSFFLVLISDMGVLGFFTSLALPVSFLMVALKTIKKYKNAGKLTYYTILGLSAAGASMFIRGIVDGLGLLAYGFLTAEMPFWMMYMGLAYYYINEPKPEQKKIEQN